MTKSQASLDVVIAKFLNFSVSAASGACLGQTIDGSPIHAECTGNFHNRFTRLESLDRLPLLVRRTLRRPSELNSASLRTLPALTSAGADQGALELGKAAQDGEHERAMRRRGVGFASYA